ncbi:MAG: NUDIX hydrolase [Clostridia bacterium]|nr:NUDIX hydrolase [Clostridia bacterium]
MKPIRIVRKHKGKFISVYDVHYETGGKEHVHEVVSRKGTVRDPEPLDLTNIGDAITGVVCLVLNDTRDSVCLVQEYRPAANAWVCDLPMGMVDPGETPEEAAVRETKEETGLDGIKVLKTFKPTFTNPSMSDSKAATVVLQASGNPRYVSTEHEHIAPLWLDIFKIKELLFHENCPPMSGRAQSLLLALVASYGFGGPCMFTNDK